MEELCLQIKRKRYKNTMKCDMEIKYTDCEGIRLHIETIDMI